MSNTVHQVCAMRRRLRWTWREGLAYMHAKKAGAIIHRDLKPANLMISGSMYQSQCAPRMLCTGLCETALHGTEQKVYVRVICRVLAAPRRWCIATKHKRYLEVITSS